MVVVPTEPPGESAATFDQALRHRNHQARRSHSCTFKGDVGYETIQQLSGVLPVFAAVFPADDRQDSWTMRVIDP